GVEIRAVALVAVGGEDRVPEGPVESIVLDVVGSGRPRRTTPGCDRIARPRLRSGFSRLWDGPDTPRQLAGRGFIGCEKAAQRTIAARDTRDHEVTYHQRSR